jgi:hypothetical protein
MCVYEKGDGKRLDKSQTPLKTRHDTKDEKIKERTTLTIEAETERIKKDAGRAVVSFFFGLASRDCALIIRSSLVFAKVLGKDQVEWCLPGMGEADMELRPRKGP